MALQIELDAVQVSILENLASVYNLSVEQVVSRILDKNLKELTDKLLTLKNEEVKRH